MLSGSLQTSFHSRLHELFSLILRNLIQFRSVYELPLFTVPFILAKEDPVLMSWGCTWATCCKSRKETRYALHCTFKYSLSPFVCVCCSSPPWEGNLKDSHGPELFLSEIHIFLHMYTNPQSSGFPSSPTSYPAVCWWKVHFVLQRSFKAIPRPFFTMFPHGFINQSVSSL